jgi:hypothetical protein
MIEQQRASLDELVAEASAIYLTEWEGLAQLVQRVTEGKHFGPSEVTPANLLEWLGQIRHDWGRHRSAGCNHAYADGRKQRIVYNPHHCMMSDREMNLDLVLHEMGHLFCSWYIDHDSGHDYRWQNVGAIVGYAWVGSTGDERRRLYIAAAKKERVLRSMRRKLEQMKVAA